MSVITGRVIASVSLMLSDVIVMNALPITGASKLVRDVVNAIVKWEPQVLTVRTLLDSADVNLVLPVRHVILVNPDIGSTVHLDAPVSNSSFPLKTIVTNNC